MAIGMWNTRARVFTNTSAWVFTNTSSWEQQELNKSKTQRKKENRQSKYEKK